MKKALLAFLYAFGIPLSVFAHTGEAIEEHAEETADVAALDPVVVAAGIGGVLVAGFVVWKFLLKK